MLSPYVRCSLRAPRLNRHSFRQFANTSCQRKTASKPTLPSPASAKPIVSGSREQIQAMAAQMLQSGRDEIYKNTASKAFVGVSLGIMVVSYCGIGYLYSTKLWDREVTKARGLRWFVPVGYQATMVCWGLLAAYAFSRTLGLVKSIKLVKNGPRVLLETSIRHPIPFMRPEKHLSEPSDMVVNRAKLYGAAFFDDMITAPEGNSFISKVTRKLFYAPFHNTRKAMGGVGLVPIQVGPSGSQRHVILDVDGQFSNGGKDLLDLSRDDI